MIPSIYEYLYIIIYFFPTQRSYAIDITDTHPDDFIVQFNKEFVGIEDGISSKLEADEARPLFDGVAWLFCDLMIHAVKFTSGINMLGVRKLVRDVYTFEQNLTLTVMGNEPLFARAVKYFYLLTLSEPELIGYLEDQDKHGEWIYDADEIRLVCDKSIGGRFTQNGIQRIEQLLK